MSAARRAEGLERRSARRTLWPLFCRLPRAPPPSRLRGFSHQPPIGPSAPLPRTPNAETRRAAAHDASDPPRGSARAPIACKVRRGRGESAIVGCGRKADVSGFRIHVPRATCACNAGRASVRPNLARGAFPDEFGFERPRVRPKSGNKRCSRPRTGHAREVWSRGSNTPAERVSNNSECPTMRPRRSNEMAPLED